LGTPSRWTTGIPANVRRRVPFFILTAYAEEAAMGTSLDQLADDLKSVLDGTLTPEEFRMRHPTQNETGAVLEVLCLVEHYLTDADIRSRDFDYRCMQESEMKKLISALRSGRVNNATKIHFLGYSD
jgi:hypothetical protein